MLRPALVLLSFASIACAKSTPRKAEPQDAAPPPATPSIATTTTAVDAGDAGVAVEPPTGGRANVDFSCDAVTFRRAWKFKGESAITPSEVAELAAFHVTTRVTEGISFRLEAGGRVFDTSLQFVRADAKGMPVDRFYESTAAWNGPLDLVAIGAVPRGTSKLTLTLRDRTIGSSKQCQHQVTLGDGPIWPLMPRYVVSRYAVTRAKTLLLLYRADNVLLEETSAPTLYWKPPGGSVVRNGVRVQEVRSGLPRAMAATNEKGDPIEPDPKAKSRFVVAEYTWGDAATKEMGDLPNEFTAGDRMSPLPPITPWTVSKELNDALDESMKIETRHGHTGAAIFLHGGKPALERMIDAGVVSRF